VFIHYGDDFIGRPHLQKKKQQTSCAMTFPSHRVLTTPSTPLADDDPLLAPRYCISLGYLLTSPHWTIFTSQFAPLSFPNRG